MQNFPMTLSCDDRVSGTATTGLQALPLSVQPSKERGLRPLQVGNALIGFAFSTLHRGHSLRAFGTSFAALYTWRKIAISSSDKPRLRSPWKSRRRSELAACAAVRHRRP